jgi:hypothetical protein
MRSLPIIIAAFLLIISCKKKEPEKPTVAGNSPSPGIWTTTTGGPTTGGTSTTGGSTTSSAPVRFHGTMFSLEGTFENSNNTFSFHSAMASFNTVPVDIPLIEFSNTLVRFGNTFVGTVRLNGDSLSFSEGDYFTNTTTSSVIAAQDVWMADGGNGFPHVQLQNSILKPVFQNLSGVPKQVSLSSGFSFDVSASNARRGVIALTDQNTQGSSTPKTYSVPLQTGNNHVEITPSNLSGMITTSNALMYLVIENYTTATIQGKDFKFGRQVEAIKSITLTP